MENKVFKAILGALVLGVVTVPVMARGGSGSGHSSGSSHYVAPHVTKNGIYVEGHMQTNPNGTKLDNWSTKGNVNPYTGQPGTKNPDGPSSANTGAKTLTSTAGSTPHDPGNATTDNAVGTRGIFSADGYAFESDLAVFSELNSTVK